MGSSKGQQTDKEEDGKGDKGHARTHWGDGPVFYYFFARTFDSDKLIVSISRY